jgi:hypothetical protein
LIIFLSIVEINLMVTTDHNAVTSTPISVNSPSVTPDAHAVLVKFQEIKAIPYNEQSMNCKNKSELFAAYLQGAGATNINLVTIQYASNTYSHEFVDWNGHFYDPCNDREQSYLVSKETYLKDLNNLGFTGMIIESPYVGQQ